MSEVNRKETMLSSFYFVQTKNLLVNVQDYFFNFTQEKFCLSNI